FDRLESLVILFRIDLSDIKHLELTSDHEVYQLANGHPRIYPNRLGHRYFQSPSIAKTHIAVPCRSMNINSQATCTRLSFQKRHVRVCLGISQSHPQIQYSWLKHISLFGDFE